MKSLSQFLFTLLALSAHAHVHADGYDEKSKAARQREDQMTEEQQRQKQAAYTTLLNNQVFARVPRNSVITKCVTEHAFFDFQLQMSEWNGIPLEIATDEANANWSYIPPQILSCHYHLNSTGQDCAVTAGGPGKKGYDWLKTTCF